MITPEDHERLGRVDRELGGSEYRDPMNAWPWWLLIGMVLLGVGTLIALVELFIRIAIWIG